MKTKRMAGIFIFLALTAVLCVIIASRANQTSHVVIDGGHVTEQPDSGTSAENTPEPTATPKPAPTPSLPNVDVTSWEFVLANKDNSMETTPQVSEIGDTETYFDSRAVSALKDMTAACKKAGCDIHINLAYVPVSSQEYYFDRKAKELSDTGEVNEDSIKKTRKYIAQPGQSDHQTGLGVDFTDRFCTPYTNETLSSEALEWLTENCASYGFVPRYPAGKENITGYRQTYHFRYVGVDAAQYMMKNDLCLEEFLALYK